MKLKKISYGLGIFVVLILVGVLMKGVFEKQSNDFVAKVNGHEITLEEYRQAYVVFVPQTPQTEEQNKQTVLNNLINYQLFLEDAKKRGIVISEKELYAVLENLSLQKGMNISSFIQTNNQSGQDYETLKTRIEENLLVNKVLEIILQGTKISKEEVKKYYEENTAKLDRKSTRLNSSHTDISRMPSSA